MDPLDWDQSLLHQPLQNGVVPLPQLDEKAFNSITAWRKVMEL